MPVANCTHELCGRDAERGFVAMAVHSQHPRGTARDAVCISWAEDTLRGEGGCRMSISSGGGVNIECHVYLVYHEYLVLQVA